MQQKGGKREYMLVCLECGEPFYEDEVVYWEETHGLPYGPYEQWSGSPCCRGGYTEAYCCDMCGEWTTDPYIEADDMIYCDNCYAMKIMEED